MRQMVERIRVIVWNEGRHEQRNAAVRAVYPEGIHGAIAAALREQTDLAVRTATLDAPEHGLTEEALRETDALLWWGHIAHEEVREEVAERVVRHVLEGMGLIVLHSGHLSKVFRRLMGTSCTLKWREADERERIWNVEPGHPVAAGIGETIELERTEMYGERFDVPPPERVVFISWYEGGEVFRSGCTWERGYGRVFYLAPGHETYPIYYQPQIRRVLVNAVRWVRPRVRREHACRNVPPLEKLGG